MNQLPSQAYLKAVESDSIRKDEGQLQALRHLDAVQQRINQPSPERKWYQRWSNDKHAPLQGAYLWGGVGTGKTLIMDMFYQSLSEGQAKRIHFHRYMQSVHEQKQSIKQQQNPLAVIAREFAEKHRVLCLDEFAVTDITDAMILHGLLRHLFAEGVVLITTSNTQPENLYKNGLQRARFLPAIELLKQHTVQVKVDQGIDYRMAFLQNAAIYITPANADSDRRLAQTFEQLAGQDHDSKTSLVISGREVPVNATGSGTVWFECDVLCESPRSKVDYIELSKRFHTLFLSNVPVFTDLQDDAARRFIELIDEMYDRGVNVILSAQALPDQLYQGKKLQEPFQRTISRLQEMQSDAYLARPHLP